MVALAARYRERLRDSREQGRRTLETKPTHPWSRRRQVSAFALGAILEVRFILNSLRRLECLAQGHTEEGGEGWKETRL
jgi:hypothetical protein